MNNRRIRRKIGLAILSASAVMLTVWLGLSTYMIEETILFLLIVAALVVAGVLLVIAFVLFQEGVRRGMLCLKFRLVLITRLSKRLREAMSHSPVRH